MTAIDTRRVTAGVCADGHAMQTFDLILGGRVYESAAILHEQDIYFEPAEFRRWIEADHALLHAVAEALIDARMVRS